MSRVDSFILLANILNEEDEVCISKLNESLKARDSRNQFVQVDEHAGGYKTFGGSVFLFAGNWFDLNDMAELIGKIKWPHPEEISLVHMEEEDFRFHFYTLEELKSKLQEKKNENAR